ncbi:MULTISPECIES: hypothetical protein [unclassified Streptomyces]
MESLVRPLVREPLAAGSGMGLRTSELSGPLKLPALLPELLELLP